MITEKQLKIFQVLAKQPFTGLTRKQVKQASGEKSNNALAIAIKRFNKEGIIKEQNVGRSSLVSLNHENDLVYCYIALANLQRMDKVTFRTTSVVKEEIQKHTPFYSLVIFGSFAMQEQKKSSDLDIAIFIENGEKRELIEAAINSAAQKSLLPIDAHVITKGEFIEMLANEEENLGKQIARKHLSVHNHQLFYCLVKEGMKHGFHF
ncbi:nucleotidyltransferase domain-containing protein [Candidatus Woesearchaeota archaeon]|nr:nucleotidyltransferase domain-containing protein [Candidatus Woesearchaeota archaeon]